jgi:very-short-patch-repair endonuclease
MLRQLLSEWLLSIKIPYSLEYTLEDKIIDIHIPQNNILIEIDSLRGHSDNFVEDNYNISKKELCIKNGYTPLFFRENEILTQFDIVKSIILNKLGKSNRIFARKCVSKEVDRETARTFFKDNHLMGNGTGKTYGLYFEDNLVTALQLRGHREGYEISRFCHSLNTNVIGGFSKLISQVRTLIGDKTLLTFIDLRYGGGKYLESLGFTYKHTYPSFKWTDGNETYNRMQFPGNLGYEKQLAKLWDCGQAKYVLANEIKEKESL